jgi:hypothetical protein
VPSDSSPCAHRRKPPCLTGIRRLIEIVGGFLASWLDIFASLASHRSISRSLNPTDPEVNRLSSDNQLLPALPMPKDAATVPIAAAHTGSVPCRGFAGALLAKRHAVQVDGGVQGERGSSRSFIQVQSRRRTT